MKLIHIIFYLLLFSKLSSQIKLYYCNILSYSKNHKQVLMDSSLCKNKYNTYYKLELKDLNYTLNQVRIKQLIVDSNIYLKKIIYIYQYKKDTNIFLKDFLNDGNISQLFGYFDFSVAKTIQKQGYKEVKTKIISKGKIINLANNELLLIDGINNKAVYSFKDSILKKLMPKDKIILSNKNEYNLNDFKIIQSYIMVKDTLNNFENITKPYSSLWDFFK